MSNCPYCDVLIDEAYNFCVGCEEQVKCLELECGSYLIKNKTKCLKCGKLLNTAQPIAIPMNTFSLEEEQSDTTYSRKISLSFTDNAVDKVAPALNGYVPLTPAKTIKQVTTVTQPQQQLSLPSLQIPEGSSQVDKSEIMENKVIETSVKSVSGNNAVSDYFVSNAQGLLISFTKDYKGKSKKLQQQRFSLLYVWAYEAFHEKVLPSKEHLIQAARANEIYDNHYSENFDDVANRYFIKFDNTFKLNPSGRSELDKLLVEMQDSDLKGYEYLSSSRKKSNQSPRITKEDTQKVEQWILQPSKFKSFDIRTLKNTSEFAIFAIYIITKELKIESAISSTLAYEYLERKYQTISFTKKLFSDTLSRKIYSKYFKKTIDGLYYLTQEAEILAQSWIV